MADIQTIWSPPDCRGDWAISPAAVAALTPGGPAGVPDAVSGKFGLYSGHDLQIALLIRRTVLRSTRSFAHDGLPALEWMRGDTERAISVRLPAPLPWGDEDERTQRA